MLCDASAFQFQQYVAGFFLQFAFQIGNIFFKTDDPPSGHDLLPVGQRAVSRDISTYGFFTFVHGYSVTGS